MDGTSQARVAAIWMVHGALLARLLRASGRDLHARNLEAALAEASDILAEEIGRARLSAAMDWVSERAWGEAAGPAGPRH